jgi:hypothetical protein
MLGMKRFASLMNRLKPGVPKRALLLAAALAWTFAGAMLGERGTIWLLGHADRLIPRFAIAIILGLVFFRLVFAKVSLRHIRRIHGIAIVKPCLFSFFDTRSWIMMATMISAGVTLRLSGLVDLTALSTFYILMGTPLLVSALRFWHAFWRYPRPERGV